jgi:hypothetical protein
LQQSLLKIAALRDRIDRPSPANPGQSGKTSHPIQPHHGD